MADAAELRIVLEEEVKIPPATPAPPLQPAGTQSPPPTSTVPLASTPPPAGGARSHLLDETTGVRPTLAGSGPIPAPNPTGLVSHTPPIPAATPPVRIPAPELARSAAPELAGDAAGAGPVGAVIAAVGLASQAIGELGMKAGQVAQEVGRFGVSLAGAGRDPARFLLQAGDAAATLAGKIPILGPALEGLGKGAVKAAGAFTDVTEAFILRGQQLARFSPQLAGANAVAQVRQTLGDIREAQRVGPEVARLTDNWSRLQDILRERFEPLEKWAAGILADITGFFANALDEHKKANEALKELQTLIDKHGAAQVKKMLGRDDLEGLMKKLQEQAKGTDYDEIARRWLNGLKNQVGEEPPQQAMNIEPLKERLAIPAFQGLNMNPQFGMGG